MPNSADSTLHRAHRRAMAWFCVLALAAIGAVQLAPPRGSTDAGQPPANARRRAEHATAPTAWAMHALARRVPAGATALPVGYLDVARRDMRGMRTHATAARALGKRADAEWEWLGPDNVAGRTRSLLFDPRNPERMLAGGVSGGIWESLDRGRSWRALSDDAVNLNVGALAFQPDNPDVIYVGTGELYRNNEIPYAAMSGAGILRSRDGGQSFQQLLNTANSQFRYVADVVVSSIDVRRVYAATNSGLWRSRDGGANWQQILRPVNAGNEPSYEGCTELQLLPDATRDVLLASCASRSVDDRYYQPGTLLPPACSGPCPAAVFRSDDAGADAAWTTVLSEPGMGRTSIDVSRTQPNIVYALSASIVPGFDRTGDGVGDYDNGLHALFRSDDGGRSWTARLRNDSSDALSTYLLSYADGFDAARCGFGANFVYSAGWYNQAIAVHPEHPDVVWVGGMDLYRSDDGGRSFGKASYWWLFEQAPEGIHADQHRIVYPPDYRSDGRRELYVTNDGGVALTSDDLAATTRGANASCGPNAGTTRWEARTAGLGTTQFYAGSVSSDGSLVLGGLQDNGTQRARCTGADCSWTRIRGGDGGYNAIDPRTSQRVYTTYQGPTLARSEDGGNTHAAATAGISDQVHFIMPFVLDRSVPDRLYAAGTRLWRSDNRGNLWRAASARFGTAFADRISAIAVAASDPNRILLGNQSRIFRNHASLASTGTTVWASAAPRSGWVSSLAFDPNNANIAYATYSTLGGGAHVWRSADGGASWSALDGNGDGRLPDVPVHSIVVDPGDPQRLFIGSDVGVFASVDGGAHWAIEHTGFASAITESLAIAAGDGSQAPYLYAFTYGRGVWRVPLATLDGVASYRIDDRVSGAWYDPARSGEGFVVQPIAVGGALHLSVAWYTYERGQPLWLFGSGAVDGDHARIALYSATGADFPPEFAVGDVRINPWGELVLEFASPTAAQASWTSTRDGFAPGTMPLLRFGASIAQDGRSGSDGIAACHIGSWYNPAQSGHGLSIDIYQVGEQRMLAAVWYVYVDGTPVWLTGAGPIDGDQAELRMIRTAGADFGAAFDPADVQRIPIGNLRFRAQDASHAQLQWDFNEPRFGQGELDLVQFARVLDRDCGG